ncbi:RHS repeat-associated core domain-containing protein [Photobacterium nomapromontoriensis]|uniref:RHS repeat-associated core domain-containing protein n=1 Tax=Photobacterium nomapromontoriensis TaxID=2910237 RepID=UPI003D111590
MQWHDTHYRYDRFGNQVKTHSPQGNEQRRFNGLNQLTSFRKAGKYTQYHYDALGRRSAKISESQRIDYLWDGDQLIGEHCNGEYRWYLYEPGSFSPVALIAQGEIYYYQLDHLGTPLTLTDQHGDIAWQADYTTEGVANLSIERIGNPLRFQGQYYDVESGLHYNRFRYYDPTVGRFIHQDPIGLVGGINPYQYAPNPVQWVDPLGLSCKESKAQPPYAMGYNRITDDSNSNTYVNYKALEGRTLPPDAGISGWDAFHGSLDAAGLAPGVGIIPDGINALVYTIRGKWVDAGWSLGAMIPAAGQGVMAAKYGTKIDDVIEGTEEAVDLASSPTVVKEVSEKIDNVLDFGVYSTKIDTRVSVIEKNTDMPAWLQESFLDSTFRSVITNEDITVYRVFGSSANIQGAFVSTTPALSKIQVKIDSALLPEWKNTRKFEAEILIPKGTKLDIGKVAPQTIGTTGTVLNGGSDQLLMSQNWPKEWIVSEGSVKP